MRGSPRHLRGYLLLPVAVAIALIGVIAFLISRQSAIEVELAAGELDTARAEYVAQAGLQHALRELAQQGCGPYTDLVAISFGADQYGTSLTTDLGTTASYSLTVDQDAWIGSFQSSNNHGSDSTLHVSESGSDSETALLRYDLSALPGGVSILSATAWFHVDAAYPQNPLELHRLTADWGESDASWDSMSANIDAAVLAILPAQPTTATWVAVDLTSQVQAWVNGEPNYGLAILANTDNVDAAYDSRETANSPYLEVIAGVPPTPQAQVKSVGTLASGASRKILREVVLQQRPASYAHLQPDALAGKDAEIWDQAPNNNYGTATETWVSSAATDTTRTLLQFDLGTVPAGARILHASLSLERWSGSGADQPVSAHRILNPWNESTVTWNQAQTGINWDTVGADFDGAAVTTTPVGPLNQRYEWEIAPLVQGWVEGRYPNHGVILVAGMPGMPGERFYTSDHADPSRWPRLSITFACECGQICVAPQGTGEILMVVINPTTLVAEDQKARDLFESWGYTVNVISESANQTAFDAAIANNDVVFISETVNSSQVGSKLVNATIGVVSQDGVYNPDLGLASGVALTVADTIDVVDTDHYITRPFATGPLPIYDAGMEQAIVSGSLTAGQQSLAETGGVGSLVVLEQGAAMEGGGNAVGRRAILPLGTRYRFDWDRLNANGRILVQRALEWGMENLCTPQWASWRVGAGNDDAEERGDSSMYLDSSDLELTEDGAQNQTVGIRFQAVGIPPGATITEAYLDFTVDEITTVATTVEIRGELSADAVSFSGADGDISGRPRTAASAAWTGIPAWDTVGAVHSSPDIAPLIVEIVNAPGWSSGNSMAFIISGNGTRIAEAYEGAPAQAPLLRVSYCGDAADATQLLFVVANAAGMTAQEDAKKLLFESWGYSVNPIDADDPQADFDAAVTTNDVVFIGEDVTASDVNTKLVGATIGVVTEEANLADEFGFAGGVVWGSGTDIDITLSHYITETIGLGTHSILTTGESLAALDGAQAPDLQILATTADGVALAALDSGAAMTPAGNTSGRRVFLPWGGNDMDVNHLDADGLTILRRALEWAGGAGVGDPTAPFAHWKLDDGAGTTATDSAGGNDGSLTNGPTWVSGLLDGGLHFDGSDDYVDAGTFDVAGSGITLMAWFNADAIASDDPRLISKASGTAEADAWWQLSFSDSGADRYLRMRVKASGTTTTLADTTTNVGAGEWHLATATYDNATGEMKLYLDGLEIASRAHAVGGTLDTDASVSVTLGSNAGTARFFDGILDDVRVYNRALGATEISDLYDAGAPALPGYTELYEPWTAATPDNWEAISLAPFGVPADAVVEVAVINEGTSAQRWGGVRSVGSTVDRRIQLHEAEAGGIDMVTMHVQADASSQIQHYSDNTGQVSFILLGYWTGASYTDALEPFTANSQGTWVEEGVGDDGVSANQVAEILILNTNTDAERLAGVRASGATHQRRFMLHEAEGGGVDALSLMVAADASSIIEVYSGDTGDIEFYVLGTWNTPPGTYTGTGGAHGQVSAPNNWETIDLSSFGVPADSIAQFVLANENPGTENSMRVREVGSTINNRGLLLHEAEAGGSDLGSLHANVDAGQQVQWAAQQGATGGFFYPVGWWVISP